MASRVYSEYREPLSAMVSRMNEIHTAREFSKESNPFGPTIICNAFSHSITCLSANLEIKLIVYKLFDKFVVRNIGRIYHEINEMFVAAGVLPTIKYKMPMVKAAKSSARKSGDKTNTTAEPQVQKPNASRVCAPHTARAPEFSPVPANVFDSIRQALHQYRGEPPPQNMNFGSAAGGNAVHAGTASPHSGEPEAFPGKGAHYVTSDIIAGLSSIQNNTAIASFHGGSKNNGEVI
jgi:hypothetical protein